MMELWSVTSYFFTTLVLELYVNEIKCPILFLKGIMSWSANF